MSAAILSVFLLPPSASPTHSCIRYVPPFHVPRNANRSLNPLRPWSKLLCVTASHFTSSVSIWSPPDPSILMYASSNLRGSSLTLKTGPLGNGRVRNGAVMRGGVCCHRGRSACSVSKSGALDGALVENAHAEVRTRACREGDDDDDDDVTVEMRVRRGRADAIEARDMVFGRRLFAGCRKDGEGCWQPRSRSKVQIMGKPR